MCPSRNQYRVNAPYRGTVRPRRFGAILEMGTAGLLTDQPYIRGNRAEQIYFKKTSPIHLGNQYQLTRSVGLVRTRRTLWNPGRRGTATESCSIFQVAAPRMNIFIFTDEIPKLTAAVGEEFNRRLVWFYGYVINACQNLRAGRGKLPIDSHVGAGKIHFELSPGKIIRQATR